MTDPLTLLVAVVAIGTAAVAAWLHQPRPPELEAERWFKVWLATRLRGRVEAAGGDADAWTAEVLRFVPFHPAGRHPEGKVASPHTWRPADAWLEGEESLVQRLAALSSPRERWTLLYDRDERGLEARLADPVTLGPAYDPGRILGPGHSWDAVATGGLTEALAARIGARWVLVDGREASGPDLLAALGAQLPASVRVPWSDGDLDATVERTHVLLQGLVPSPADRLVVVGAGLGIQVVLRVLVRDPGLRDRVIAVVSVGGVLAGMPDEEGALGQAAVKDWMARWFGHDTLDTDALVPTPYLSLQWWDPEVEPPGVAGLPLASARWPTPRAVADVPASIAPTELGLLPADPAIPLDAVAESLVGVTVGMVLAWRGD